MAQAPDPTRLTADEEREENARRIAFVMRLTIDGVRQERRVDLGEIGNADDIACRKATGLPTSAFLEGALGADSLLVLWWIGGRQAGLSESYKSIVERFPTYTALQAADPDIEEEVEDVADPEA